MAVYGEGQAAGFVSSRYHPRQNSRVLETKQHLSFQDYKAPEKAIGTHARSDIFY